MKVTLPRYWSRASKAGTASREERVAPRLLKIVLTFLESVKIKTFSSEQCELIRSMASYLCVVIPCNSQQSPEDIQAIIFQHLLTLHNSKGRGAPFCAPPDVFDKNDPRLR